MPDFYCSPSRGPTLVMIIIDRVDDGDVAMASYQNLRTRSQKSIRHLQFQICLPLPSLYLPVSTVLLFSREDRETNYPGLPRTTPLELGLTKTHQRIQHWKFFRTLLTILGSVTCLRYSIFTAQPWRRTPIVTSRGYSIKQMRQKM